ncbi:gamma-glutamyltransferase family protein [Pikeienuella sp. HZG-20]|uniref:gamma-glutamyltransferase family protein n=1 Tax=Paludibacillus litoralis TaxID=3133267 RepID=UPI0030EDB9AC
MRYAALLALALPFAALAEQPPQPETTFAVQPAAETEAARYMVIAAHPLAAEAGRAMLAAGGTAADAAIAAQLVLTLVEPQSSGLGGGAFALYWDAAARRLTTYDGRETAPLAAGPDYWLDEDGAPLAWRAAVPGGKSVGAPGTPALLQYLHDRHGALPLPALATPAIALAETGFTVSPRLAASIAEAAESLAPFPAAAAYFTPGGAPLAAGDTLKNPALAETLRRFASEGAAPFYAGDLAEAVVRAVRAAPINPGRLSMADLAAYEVKTRPAICHPYRDLTVCGMGPPSSGALTVGQILMMLDHHDLGAAPTPAAWRLYAEASRLAFADRGLYIADSDFTALPEGLLDPDYMAARARLISPERAGAAAPGRPPWKEGALRAPDASRERPGTSQIVIRDASGDILSMTTTIETGFGGRLMANGYLLNNELTDFSFAPEAAGAPVANRVEGGKRPRSSMAPTIAFRGGRPAYALGSPGGSRIIGYVAAALIGLVDWGMSPAEAAALGHVTAAGAAVDLEEGTAAAALAADMRAFGLEPRVRNMNSGLAILRIEDGVLTGAADPRREGVALGE